MLCENLNWFETAKAGDALLIDIAFVHVESLYNGPDLVEEVMSGRHRIPLPKPSFVKGNCMMTADAVLAVDELVSYYREWASLSRKLGRKLELCWIRPVLWGIQDSITFPWTDSYSDCVEWVDKVTADNDGELFWDCDQGWEVGFHGEGNTVFVAQTGGPENPEVRTAYRFARAPFQEKARAAGARVTSLVQKVNSEVGVMIFK